MPCQTCVWVLCEVKLARAVVLLFCHQRQSHQLSASAVQIQTFHHPSQSQGASSLQARARPLFWLCQSPPLALTSASGNSACPSVRCSIRCREGDSVFLCQLTNRFRPSIQQHHLAQAGDKIP